MITFKNKKKNIIVALFLFIALAIAGLLFATPKKGEVKADDYTPYFVIEDGISIKLNEDGGMRFIAKMDTTIGEALIDGEKTMQFIIAPTAIFDYANENNIEFINLPKKIVVDVDKDKVYPDNADAPTCYYANGCVTKMNESNFHLAYEAVGYIVGERYTARNSNAAGTYYEKVNATFLNQNVEQQILALERYSWYGTDKYPINVKNATQYEKLVAKCNAGNTAFNDKYIICENEVTWDSNDFTNEAAKPQKSNDATITYTDADNNTYATYKVATGAKAPKPAMSPSKASDAGYKYKFSAWSYNDAAWDFAEQTVNEDVTLTSTFAKKAIDYTITYHTMDGVANTNPTTYTIETPTFAFEKASKDGYYFDGWYTDAGFGTSFSGIETGTTGNKDVYASFVDTSLLTNEISSWAGDNIGGALNSSAVVDTFGSYNIYKTNGGYGQSIVNTSIDASNYTELHFAFKASERVTLNSGDYDKNVITANTWYFVKLEKQTDGNWIISVKAFGESDYTALEGSFDSNAMFETMFKTYLWIADAMNNNHEVYATDVWGFTVVDSEIAAWEAAGAEKIGSALNSSEAIAETLDGLTVYKTNGGYGQSIVNTSIDASNYSELHFAFKASARVTLNSGDYNTNVIPANTWYFVQLKKQEDGSWTISVKKVGDSAYTALEGSIASGAAFDVMFKTYLHIENAMQNNHEVYATDVWGVSIVGSEIAAWEAVGAEKIGSALNSSVALAETLGGLAVYKTNGGFNRSIANLNIDASNYTELHFAYKTNTAVNLSNTDNQNANIANTWYFVKLEKQEGGNWTISAKKVGDSDYIELTAKPDFFGAGNAKFDLMFRTNLWTADTYNHEVYATDVWGVEVKQYLIVEDLIDTLPDSITSADIDAVFAAQDAYKALSDRQQAKVNADKLTKLNNALGQVFALETSTWAGANKVLDNTLNDTAVKVETFGSYDIYSKTGLGYGGSGIGSGNIQINDYKEVYFMLKATYPVSIFSGDWQAPKLAVDTWYAFKLVKGAEHWSVYQREICADAWVELVLDNYDSLKSTESVSFNSALITVTWDADVSYDVFATGLWGIEDDSYKSVETLIDELPDRITNADIDAVFTALNAYQALSAAQQAKIDAAKVAKLNNSYAQIVDLEIAAWEAAGADKIGSALNSNEALAETLSGLAVYKTNGGYGKSIVNTSIDASNYTKLYFAFKTNQQVTLSNGNNGVNTITPNTWYFVSLEKQESGNWTISAKVYGDSEYTAFTASDEFFGAGKATFATMFRTYLWTADEYNHEVYATDVWGVNVVDSEIAAWETAGAEKIGSALNSSDALTETLYGVTLYKTNGGYNQSIVNASIDASNYTQLHFAFKANARVNLNSGDYNTNVITANTWYFVKLEKHADGSWMVSVKGFGESEYTTLDGSFASGATFDSMFKTYLYIDGNLTDNHEVYATDVWGVSVVVGEIAAWETAGAVKLGSALNSSEALDEKLGSLSVYKTNGGYGQGIANTSIDVSSYTELHFAFKATQQVNLSNGDYDKNIITPNTWYFVSLEKQEGGNWTISVKKVGDSDYTPFTASEEFFGAGNATFDLMFRTNLWMEGAMQNNHEVYATDVWGVECDCSNAVWDGNTYKCSFCQEILGTVTDEVAQTTEVVLFTNATYAGKGATGNAFDASAARAVTIDFSVVTALDISGITNVALNGVSYTVSGLESNQVTIDGVVPYDVFGEYTLTAQITVKGATFDIQMPILVITDLITDADGLLNVRKVLRGQDAEIAHDTANPVDYLVVGGTGGLGTMNGRGYYKLGDHIDLANYSIANVNTNTVDSYNRVYVFGTTAVPFTGTFDGAGYVLDNFISKPNFWNYNVTTGFTYLFQDPQGVTGDSHAQEIEASLFGMVDGTIKNLAITNAVFGQNGNIVNGGGGTLKNVYMQINDLQADAYTFVAPIAQHVGVNNMTLTTVVVDLTKQNSAILNGSAEISTRYPSVIGSGAANIENVGVYGFNTAWIDAVAGRGNVYTGNTDGSAAGIYTAGLAMTNSKASFWQVSLDSTIWKIVDGVPMLINVSTSGTAADEDSWTGEEGNGYNIAWSDEVAGSYEAVTKIRAVTTQVTGLALGVTAEDEANIIVGTYDRYAEEAGVDVSLLATDGRVNYGVYNNGSKIYVLADGEEGFRFAADMLVRQLYGYNELAEDSFTWTWTDSTISLENVENETAQVAFSEREPANGYNSGDMSFNATETYTTYGDMHNTLDYLYATDGSGNITGSEIVPVTGKNDTNQNVTYTTTSYWLASNCDDVRDADNIAGEQLCYLAHGDKTAFNALVDHVVNRILEIAKARPNMTAINFMIEDDFEYCMCATCKPFYNPSIPQLIFLNTVAEKLADNEYLKNSCRTIDIVFFAYSSYSYAPITSTAVATSALANAKSALGLSNTATETVSFTYKAMNKAGATYAAANDTTSISVLKAHKNLRLQWTTQKAFHSYALTHEANSTIYLELMAWLASVDVSKTEVFMYQTTFSDYFLPLNTWKYQVEWYKNLNDMGINGYIFNLGNMGNPADAQTGFSAFKTYIDSRAMTDSSVTYEQLKNEFFSASGYYGAAGPTMRTFFEELESVMEAKKQTGNYVDPDSFSHSDYNATSYPYYHYYTDGTSDKAVRTTYENRVQAWFNGAFDLSQTWILFGDITDEDLKVATSVGKNENPPSLHAALTLSPQKDVYQYGGKTQLETLKAWYQYCATAKGMVAADSVYAKRIQVESWFPEYALRLFHSTYTINFNLVKAGTYNYSATCTGVTSALSADTGLSRSATEFYNELIAGGMIRPGEQSTFNTTEKLSLGWVRAFYRNDGTTVFRNANCICEISASPFVNWGVF